MKKGTTLIIALVLFLSSFGSASDKPKINDEIKGQPVTPAQVPGILLQSIEQVANSAGPIIPAQFIYKGDVSAAAETLVVNPTGFTSLIDGASLNSVSRDDFGQFYVSQCVSADLYRMIQRMDQVRSPMYELRFGADNSGLAADFFDTGRIYLVPFTVWDINSTPDEYDDDLQLIPAIYTNDTLGWGINDTSALTVSPWTLNPAHESTWIYFFNPVNGFNDLVDLYEEQETIGVVGLNKLYKISDDQFLRRITINSLDANPLTTVNTLNGLRRPRSGTVIRWTYSMPPRSVTFRVNMRDQILNGTFNPLASDVVVVRGYFNGWAGEAQQLQDVNGDSIYSLTYDMGSFTEDTVFYKFVIHKAGGGDIWETNNDRRFIQKDHPQTLPVLYFNNLNRITFRVDMSTQISNGNFNRSSDQLLVRGKFTDWRGIDYVLKDPDGDGVYAGSYEIGFHGDDVVEYKYVIKKPTSEIWETQGDPQHPVGNRSLLLTGSEQLLPAVYFNNEVLYDLVTISQIQQVSNPAVYDTSSLFGDTIRVQGLVLTNPTDLYVGVRQGVYVVDPINPQSPWNGLRIAQDDTTIHETNFSEILPGMIVEFTGVVDEYNNQTGVRVLTNPVVPVTMISTSNPLPDPIVLDCDDLDDRATAEQWESMWIRLNNVSVVDNNIESFLASITDATTATTYLGDYFNWFRTKLIAGTYTWPDPGTLLNVNGFVRDEAAPIGQIYSVNPRTETDLEIIPQQLSVQLFFPNGDEIWNEDLGHNIEWQASPNTTNIEIQYSTDNGQNYTMIIDSTQNDGLFRWRTPRTPSQNCKIKVIAYDAAGTSAADETDGTFIIADVQTRVHQTGTLNHTIRNDGMSGNVHLVSGLVPDEPSLEFPPNSGHHHLWSSQLLVATVISLDTVTALLYGDNFLPAQPIEYEEHGTYRKTNTIYTDKLSLGLAVEEQTFVVVGEPAVIFSYKITNQNSQTYTNFYMAFFSDFDVNEFQNNLSGYDSANRLAYMWDATGGWTSYAGVRLLNKDPRAFRRWSSFVDARNYPGFIYNKLSIAGYDNTSGDPQDEYRLLLSAGPYTLQPGATIAEAFALLAGNDLNELKQSSQSIQTFWVDTNPPGISSITTSPTNAILNQSFSVRADVTDNRGVLEVILHYRQGGNTAFTTIPMTYTGSYYQATVPASAVTVRGVEYYISARDLNNNYNASPSHMVQVYVSANSLSALTLAGGTAERAYTMISSPIQFEDARFANVLDEFGGYDKTQWRLYNDTGNQMQEYPAFSNMERGKAYWIITSNTRTINFPEGRTAPEDDYFVSLSTGWTQIGLPCNYNILWGDVGGVITGIDGPFYYNNGNYSMANVLEPFRGYYVYNGTGSTATIHFPLNGNGASVTKETALKGWKVPILARVGEARDELNIIGASANASDEHDIYDHLEPPPIGKYICVYFPHNDWQTGVNGRYSADIRAESASGYAWDMEIETNISNRQVDLSFKEVLTANIPADFNYLLIDPETRTAHDLKTSPFFTFPSPGEEKTKSLRLIIGTESFIAEHNLGIRAVPGEFELRQNYPNPFNPMTTITFGLPQTDKVSLIVYNMLGEQVRILSDNKSFDAGYHSVQWDGRNQHGEFVSSGVYFCQLRSHAVIKTNKMILVR